MGINNNTTAINKDYMCRMIHVSGNLFKIQTLCIHIKVTNNSCQRVIVDRHGNTIAKKMLYRKYS